MTLTPDDVAQFSKAASAFVRAADRIEASRSGSSSSSSFTVNAGGTTVTVSIVLALSVLVMFVQQSSTLSAQSAQIAELNRRSDRMQDYLNAIYAQAPHLKPAVK